MNTRVLREPLCWAGSTGGLANRLFGLASALTVARRLNRELHFVWTPNAECPGTFSQFFRLEGANEIGSAPKDECSFLRNPGWEPSALFREARLEFPSFFKCSKDQFLADAVAVLREIDLVGDVRQSVEIQEESLHLSDCLGIHLRETDKLSELRNTRSWKALLKMATVYGPSEFVRGLLCSEAAVRDYHRKRIFRNVQRLSNRRLIRRCLLVSDDPPSRETFRHAVEELGVECVSPTASTLSADGLRKTSLESAIRDLWLLSRCRNIIASQSTSTFSLLASLLNRTPLRRGFCGHDFHRFAPSY